jgi:hypothetical protein
VAADSHPSQPDAWFRPLALLTAGCVIVGALARFWGLGKWPLAIDEYYFAQSVQNLLHSGIPAFPCGGLYIRGLLLQYAAALLQLTGLSAELAPRLLAAIASLLTLPAVYLIGRRLGDRSVGLLVVAVLALSIWEVEIGRFGRMYSPFQAIFAWYAVFFLDYVIDRSRRALAPMILLSALSLGVWEGGVFLVLTNLLPPFIANPSGRLSRRDWAYLAGCALLLLPAYILTMADLRTAWSDPIFPADYVEPPDVPSASRLDAASLPLKTLPHHPVWLLAALIPAALSLFAVGRVVRLRPTPLAAVGLLAILGAAAAQQFEVVAAAVVVLILLGTLNGPSVFGRDSRPLQLAVLAWLAFWVAFGLGTHDWHASGLSPLKSALLLIYEFVRIPDTVRQIAMPWARTVPLLSLGLLILTGLCCLRACLRYADTPVAERVLLALFVILLLAAGASNPPRHETRYVFFLYPLAIIFSILTVRRALRALLGVTPIAAAATVVACLTLFAASEDFSPGHLWNIDTEAVNFRIGMSGRLAGHYHPRSDTRAAAVWLQEHVVPGQDLVIDSFPGVDFYYRNSDFYFVSDSDGRFDAWSCKRGTVQRWSNLPMIYSYDTLATKVASGRRVWMVVETSGMETLLAHFAPTVWTIEWTSHARDITIVSFRSVANARAGAGLPAAIGGTTSTFGLL